MLLLRFWEDTDIDRSGFKSNERNTGFKTFFGFNLLSLPLPVTLYTLCQLTINCQTSNANQRPKQVSCRHSPKSGQHTLTAVLSSHSCAQTKYVNALESLLTRILLMRSLWYFSVFSSSLAAASLSSLLSLPMTRCLMSSKNFRNLVSSGHSDGQPGYSLSPFFSETLKIRGQFVQGLVQKIP